MNKKKILILGISHPQVDAIKYCREKGFEIHGLSYKKEGVALNYLNYFKKIDITDIESVYNYAEMNNFDLIYSTGSDLAMPTVSLISERLGLPSDFTFDQIQLLTNKGSFRRYILNHNLNPIKFKIGKKISDFKEWDIFPSIIKPVDSQGQRGVRKVNTLRDIEKYFNLALSSSKKKEVILEEFLHGKEFNAVIYVFNNKIKYFFLSDRILVEEVLPDDYEENMPVGVVKKHILPTSIPLEKQQDIYNYLKKLIKSIGINNGNLYIQGKFNNGIFNLVEIAPRLEGGHIWKLIKYKHGIDLIDISFNRLLGNVKKEKDFPILHNDKYKYEIEFFHQKPQELFKEPNNFNKCNYLEQMFYYKKGQRIGLSNGFFEKTGFVISRV